MSFYKMERGWMDSNMFGDAPYSDRDAWSWMVGEARWEDGFTPINGSPMPVKRGQFYASVRFMAEKFTWSKDRVSRFLKRLEKWSSIRVETATGQNLITVCNYEEYQGSKDDPKDTTKDGVKDAPKDDPKDKLEEIQINSKKGKKEIDAPRLDADVFEIGESIYTAEQLFELLWFDYPNISAKGNKAKAREKFLKLLKTGEDHAAIITGVRGYRAFCAAEGQFNQHVATWLNQRGWEGEWLQGTGKPAGSANKKQSPSYFDQIQHAAQNTSAILNRELDGGGDGEAAFEERDAIGFDGVSPRRLASPD